MQQYLTKRGPVEGDNRGRGVACGYWATGAGPAAAHVNLNADGTVILTVGSVDVSGTRTSLAQVVAEEFGIPFENVTVVTGDSETAPFSVLSAGSMITSSLVPPVSRACRDVKEQLCGVGATNLGVDPSDVEFADGRVRVKGGDQRSISFEDLAKLAGAFGPQGVDPIIGRGASKGSARSPVLAVGAADIEVDRETGKVKVLSYAAAQDIGLAINPTMVEGQIQGAVVQGIGWALTENHVSEKGVMQNATLLDYRIPTAADVPFIEAILVEVGSDASLFGIRGVGEPPLVPTPAVMANAVHSAMGVRLKELPMDPESIVRALQNPDKSS
jgi:xanthine dehydrogenase molybdenum-binding subunit